MKDFEVIELIKEIAKLREKNKELQVEIRRLTRKIRVIKMFNRG